jgi:hypothetical protein
MKHVAAIDNISKRFQLNPAKITIHRRNERNVWENLLHLEQVAVIQVDSGRR